MKGNVRAVFRGVKERERVGERERERGGGAEKERKKREEKKGVRLEMRPSHAIIVHVSGY